MNIIKFKIKIIILYKNQLNVYYLIVVQYYLIITIIIRVVLCFNLV